MVGGSFMMPLQCQTFAGSTWEEEVHVRALVHSSTDIYFQNGVNTDLFPYSCEYGRKSLIYSYHKNEILTFGCYRSPNATAGILFVFLLLRLNIYLCKHVPVKNNEELEESIIFCMIFICMLNLQSHIYCFCCKRKFEQEVDCTLFYLYVRAFLNDTNTWRNAIFK